MKVSVDVDALYRRAFGRLADVGRLLDEFRQLRAAKGNGKRAFVEAAAPEPEPEDEEDDEDEDTARCLSVDDR